MPQRCPKCCPRAAQIQTTFAATWLQAISTLALTNERAWPMGGQFMCSNRTYVGIWVDRWVVMGVEDGEGWWVIPKGAETQYQPYQRLATSDIRTQPQVQLSRYL